MSFDVTVVGDKLLKNLKSKSLRLKYVRCKRAMFVLVFLRNEDINQMIQQT